MSMRQTEEIAEEASRFSIRSFFPMSMTMRSQVSDAPYAQPQPAGERRRLRPGIETVAKTPPTAWITPRSRRSFVVCARRRPRRATKATAPSWFFYPARRRPVGMGWYIVYRYFYRMDGFGRSLSRPAAQGLGNSIRSLLHRYYRKFTDVCGRISSCAVAATARASLSARAARLSSLINSAYSTGVGHAAEG